MAICAASLSAAASEYFKAPVTPDEVVWTYSGVRPLYDDGASKAQEATRDYVTRRTAEGKTSREIKRCLARYVARDLYRLLENTATVA